MWGAGKGPRSRQPFDHPRRPRGHHTAFNRGVMPRRDEKAGKTPDRAGMARPCSHTRAASRAVRSTGHVEDPAGGRRPRDRRAWRFRQWSGPAGGPEAARRVSSRRSRTSSMGRNSASRSRLHVLDDGAPASRPPRPPAGSKVRLCSRSITLRRNTMRSLSRAFSASSRSISLSRSSPMSAEPAS